LAKSVDDRFASGAHLLNTLRNELENIPRSMTPTVSGDETRLAPSPLHNIPNKSNANNKNGATHKNNPGKEDKAINGNRAWKTRSSHQLPAAAPDKIAGIDKIARTKETLLRPRADAQDTAAKTGSKTEVLRGDYISHAPA